MNIIELVRSILTNHDGIKAFTNNVHIDFTDTAPINFGLSSNGDAKESSDILGGQIRIHSFVLYAVNQSFEDYDRLTNSTFLLDLAEYLESYATDTTVTFGDRTGKLLELSCANGMMYSLQGEDINDGITYQIQIYARYKIESEEII